MKANDLAHRRGGHTESVEVKEDVAPAVFGAAPCSPPISDFAPYTYLTHLRACQKLGQLFESPLDLSNGDQVVLCGVPPLFHLRYISKAGECYPPEDHQQSIRAAHYSGRWESRNKDQLFVPVKTLGEDGQEKFGLWLDRASGNVIPQESDRENKLDQHSRLYIDSVDRNNPSQLSDEFSTSVLSRTESTISDISERENQQLVGSVASNLDRLIKEN